MKFYSEQESQPENPERDFNIKKGIEKIESELLKNEELAKDVSLQILEMKEMHFALDEEFIEKSMAGTASAELLKLMEEMKVNLERLKLILEQAKEISSQLILAKEMLTDRLEKERERLFGIGDERKN